MIYGLTQVIICLALVIATQGMAIADHEFAEAVSKVHYRYCGRNLVHVLTIICDGIYNRPKDGSKIRMPTDLELSRYRSKRSVDASGFQKENIRRRRGAYDECCRMGCSIKQMIDYCGNGK